MDQHEGMPELLRAVLDTNFNVFSGAPGNNIFLNQFYLS